MIDCNSIFWVVSINILLTPFIFTKNFNNNKFVHLL